MAECDFCGSPDISSKIPRRGDEKAWGEVAVEHNEWCEWVLSRANTQRHGTVEVPSAPYQGEDDSLAAAAADIVVSHNLQVSPDHEMNPRWADESRESILIDLPLGSAIRYMRER